jgi:co-chaperonin GroES (HSP10)
MNLITETIVPINDNVLVSGMSFEEQQTASGIIIQNDDGKLEGIRPRWGCVWAIGPDQHDVNVGDWVLIEHGRWTRNILTVDHDNQTEIYIRRIDPTAMMAITDSKPTDINIGANTMPDTSENYDFSERMFDA